MHSEQNGERVTADYSISRGRSTIESQAKKVNDDFLKFLNDKYGEHVEVKATRGKVHMSAWV